MKTSEFVLSNCACTKVRTAARVVSKMYDEVLRPSGLRSSQLPVLAAIDAREFASISDLSKALYMDRTTLSRNLRPLIDAKLVTTETSGQGRSKVVCLTGAGTAALAAALPLWREAQSRLSGGFGAERWRKLDSEFHALISAV